MMEFKQGLALTGLSIVLSLASGYWDSMTALLRLPELLSDSKWFLDELRNGERLFPKTLSNLFGFLTDSE